MTAGHADERLLRLPIFRRNMTADETGPARVSGIDPDKTPSPSRKLVFQEGEERPPSPGQDGAVQAGLLPDLPAGILPGAPGASGQVPDFQILDIHDGLGFADRRRGLVEKIQTHVRDPFVGSRHPDLLLPEVAALRPLPVFPGEFSLLPDELLFRPFQGFDPIRIRVDPGAVRCRGERDDPEIQSDHRTGQCDRLRDLRLGLEGDGPPARLADHGGVFEIPFDRPGDPDLDPSDLREEDPGEDGPPLLIPGREIELHLERIGIAEGVATALFLESGKSLAVRPVQSLPNPPVEVLQGLLLGLGRTVGEKPVFLARPPQGQESGQVPVGQERDSGFEPPRLKIEGLVPDKPDAPRMAGQELLLYGSRNESELDGLAGFHVFHSTQCEARLVSPA